MAEVIANDDRQGGEADAPAEVTVHQMLLFVVTVALEQFGGLTSMHFAGRMPLLITLRLHLTESPDSVALRVYLLTVTGLVATMASVARSRWEVVVRCQP